MQLLPWQACELHVGLVVACCSEFICVVVFSPAPNARTLICVTDSHNLPRCNREDNRTHVMAMVHKEDVELDQSKYALSGRKKRLASVFMLRFAMQKPAYTSDQIVRAMKRDIARLK